MIHELMHVAYDMDPQRNITQPHTLGDQLYKDAWKLYERIFRVRAPQDDYNRSHDGALPRCLQD